MEPKLADLRWFLFFKICRQVTGWAALLVAFYLAFNLSTDCQLLQHLLQHFAGVGLDIGEGQSARQLQQNWFMLRKAKGVFIVQQEISHFRVFFLDTWVMRLCPLQFDQLISFRAFFYYWLISWLEKWKLIRDVEVWFILSELPVLLVHQYFVSLCFLLLKLCVHLGFISNFKSRYSPKSWVLQGDQSFRFSLCCQNRVSRLNSACLGLLAVDAFFLLQALELHDRFEAALSLFFAHRSLKAAHARGFAQSGRKLNSFQLALLHLLMKPARVLRLGWLDMLGLFAFNCQLTKLLLHCEIKLHNWSEFKHACFLFSLYYSLWCDFFLRYFFGLYASTLLFHFRFKLLGFRRDFWSLKFLFAA